jgi:hypothetical protein
MAIGLFGLLTKLHKWDDGAMYFDGGSLGVPFCYSQNCLFHAHPITRVSAGYVFAIAVYITVIIPALRTIVTPAENVDTREDRIEAMRLLAAGNTIVMVILGAILALQVCLGDRAYLLSLILSRGFLRPDKNMQEEWR